MEVWKDIPEYEGIYQASTEGRIRTVEGKVTHNKRFEQRRWKSRVMKGRGDSPKTGKRVTLWKDGKSREWLVARLIAITFLGEPCEGYTVNHKDGDRMNTNIENLEWLSLADNIRHGFETGLYTSQKPLTVRVGDENRCFRSLSAFDRYIGRREGYTSGVLKNGGTIRDTRGRVYEIVG